MEDIERQVNRFTMESPLNVVEPLGGLRIFDPPLIGIAAADDPLFAELKKESVIGSHHLLPREWLPSAQTVISYFLPFTAAIRIANRSDGLPATEWLYGRIEGERFNEALRRFLVDLLTDNGHEAVAPALDERYQVINKRSNWSERHVAYIAGLGTLSLNCSLITARGSAGRVGSIVTSLELAPTVRPYREIYEYCTRCGACIRRCPPLAIDESGKNHQICSDYVDNETKKRYAPRYGCGKCQTAVPCEDRIPGR
ncbi:4Fe-4S ferredoxin, iron-sulfur binding domain protein [Thermosinus carboxydivorans Nor1]|uniref:4Fe-4S ferredoxin, iron-sulfur binding domain protein n=1 Tax=Thermosinus carboxydivorans Nor1 TaxID=401526 RepID=A1HQR9_9FIRM|nr:4Fe-4S ferredoxin, iron-sulfur binding domain protein [Thermosinus carboxydivorans Nor1]